MNNLCYTIGYEHIKLNEFINILRKYQINCIIDLRNAAGSGEYADEYAVKNLKATLNHDGIYYIFMGQEFTVPKNSLEDNMVDRNEDIQKGLDRILNGIKKGYNIALMSQETNAFEDIRGILVSRQLQKRGIKMLHISWLNELKTQKDLEEEMVNNYGSKLVKKVAELSIKGIMNNKDLDMDENDFKTEMVNEAYNMRFNEILERL